MSNAPGRLRAALPWLAALAVMALQWPLVANPGYFSHDELQWAVHATGAAVDWADIGAFQYRPLTFSLWSALSRALFDNPPAFHAAVVALGALNAALLCAVLRRAGATARAALAAALVFALGPFAAYVHGWVGTLGDLLWVGCALATAWACLALRAQAARAAAALVLTTLALLSKEAALSIPALLAVAWALDPLRRRQWGVALLASALPALAYLALRHGVLAQAGPRDASYAWSLANIPLRWAEYQLFPANVPVFEAFNTLARGWTDTRTLVVAALWLALVALLARRHWRWAAAFVAGGAAALGPVLVLPAAANQYGYGFAAFTAALVALAWPRLDRAGRVVAGMLGVLVVLHGVNVMRQVRAVGELQAVFSPALAQALRERPAGTVVLAPADPGSAWVFQRLTHDIPAYDGVPIGPRVRIAAPGERADLVVQADGRLSPAP